MTIQDVYKDFIDNDRKVLKACFDADKDLADAVQLAITKEISAIWYALLNKGIVTDEEMRKFKAEIDNVSKEVEEEQKNEKQ